MIELMIEILKFLFFLLIFVYLPGKFAISFIEKRLSRIESDILSLAIGIPIATMVTVIFGALGLRFFAPIIFIAVDIYLLFVKKWRPDRISFPARNLLPVVVILTAAFIQSLLMIKSGTNFNGGVAYWGVNGYDGMWHAALIQELSVNFPPGEPGFAGEALKNYHFLTDLFMADIHRITDISILDLYFRFCPIFFSVLLNSLIYIFVKRWLGSKAIALWAIFFASIAGSFGWIPPLFNKGSQNWETAFWGIQPTTAFLNPPFGVSLILLVLGLFALDLYLKQKQKSLAAMIIFVFGIMVGFKIYGGIIAIGALGILGGIELLRTKGKNKSLLVISILSGILSLIIYLPFSSGSTNYLTWQPWWFIKTMVEAPDRLNWPGLELRRQVYASYNNQIALFSLYAFTFLIFLFGNLGMRFIGFLSLIKRASKRESIDIFIFFLLLLAFLPPIFFIQKVISWNSIQFLYYFTFLFSFIGAETMVYLLSKLKFKIIKIGFVIIVVMFSVPSTYRTITWFTGSTPTTLLDVKEVEALNFLKNISKPTDILLTYPFGDLQIKDFPNPPVPMTYYNAPYVSFFTERHVYLEDLNSANLLSYDVNTRLGYEKMFFSSESKIETRNFLTDNRIRYIYVVDSQRFNVIPEDIGVIEIFNNKKARIYKVNDRI